MKNKQLLKRKTTIWYFRLRIRKFARFICIKHGWSRLHFVLNVLSDERYTFDYEVYYQRLKKVSRMSNRELKQYLDKIEKLNECIEDVES